MILETEYLLTTGERWIAAPLLFTMNKEKLTRKNGELFEMGSSTREKRNDPEEDHGVKHFGYEQLINFASIPDR